MTIGIYSITWTKENLVYVGQSSNIEKRFNEHQRKLNLGAHSNYRLQEAYSTYGIPQYSILEVCNIDQLDNLEVAWTLKLKALDTSSGGLCIVTPGKSGGSGVNHGSSKYSKFSILKVFSLLYRTKLSSKDISNKAKVLRPTVTAIMLGTQHIWLQEQYPNQYTQMLSREKMLHRPTLASKGTSVSFISPEGLEYSNITSIKEFCEKLSWTTHSLKTMTVGFSKLNTGTAKSYLGWKKK